MIFHDKDYKVYKYQSIMEYNAADTARFRFGMLIAKVKRRNLINGVWFVVAAIVQKKFPTVFGHFITANSECPEKNTPSENNLKPGR